MDRKTAIEFLTRRPDKFARMIGFNKLGEIHRKWIVDMVRGTEDKTLQASRGTYKTTCVSVALALIIILLPNKRTMFMRKTDGDVKEVLKQVQKILLDPHTQYFVQAIYGVNLRMLVASSTEILTNLTTDTKGTAQLVGIGTGASLTGKHFDRIFTDDIVNVQDRISKAERDRTKIIYQELQNIKNRGGRIFNTGTPWHKDDAFSIMPEPERYDCYQEDVRQIISEEELEDIRSKMVPSLFAANYELRFIASEDVIFVSPRVGGDPAMVEQGIVHIDAAYGGEDYTAMTICRKKDGVYYVLGKLWHRSVDEVEDEIISLRKKYNCGKVFCEDNADKGYLAKSLRNKGERVVTYHESWNKYLKIVTNLKPEWKNVVFVEGTDPEYIDQVCDYNEDADHDDAPDSLSSVVRQLLKKKDSEIDNGKYKSVYGGIYG